MPRTSAATITAWGTPPEPKPTGWDAIRSELATRPGEWANLGDYSAASARKIAKERFPDAEGYETRTVATEGVEGRSNIWVRFGGADAAAATETAAPADAETGKPSARK
jgi:hypothetical protein